MQTAPHAIPGMKYPCGGGYTNIPLGCCLSEMRSTYGFLLLLRVLGVMGGGLEWVEWVLEWVETAVGGGDWGDGTR